MLGVREILVMISGVCRMVSIIYNREERGWMKGGRGIRTDYTPETDPTHL